MKAIRVALVYDRVNKFGGAERVLMALHEIWPDAPLYTAVYDPKNAKWAKIFQVIPSFIQRFPWAKRHHELYALLTPIAFESFSFDDYDIVISVTSAEAKNILTKPHTVHICYCLTPTRYLWSGYDEYAKNANIGVPQALSGFIFKRVAGMLKGWDIVASARPDYYIAISKLVAARIVKYYHTKVEKVIYPPVDTTRFTGQKKQRRLHDSFFLVVSRLVGYKRLDIIVEAFNQLGWPLVVIGDGHEAKKLKVMASEHIKFISKVTDQELANFYRRCRAFVFAGEEDFGIAAVEAQSAGVPVIAYKKSGLAEVVQDGITGMLFEEQTVESLVDALKKFTKQWYDSSSCVSNAERFSKTRFQQEMKNTVLEVYNRHI